MKPVNVYFVSNEDGLGATVSMWGTASLPNKEDGPEELIIVIPGNPGLVNFYYEYATHLHEETKLPVWVIGHAGHSEGDLVENKKNVLDLKKQLQHKMDFIEKHTSPLCKIHLVGHSVGGWMTAEILQSKGIEQRVASASLLFPTLEFIAKTPNGFWLNGFVRNITSLVLLGVYIFTILPRFISRILVYFYFLIVGYPYDYIPIVYIYLQVHSIKRCLGLAYNEMDAIKEMNITVLSNNTHRIKILFNDSDGWAPGPTFDKLRSALPNLHIEETFVKHSFVLGQSRQIANITSRFITT